MGRRGTNFFWHNTCGGCFALSPRQVRIIAPIADDAPNYALPWNGANATINCVNGTEHQNKNAMKSEWIRFWVAHFFCFCIMGEIVLRVLVSTNGVFIFELTHRPSRFPGNLWQTDCWRFSTVSPASGKNAVNLANAEHWMGSIMKVDGMSNSIAIFHHRITILLP